VSKPALPQPQLALVRVDNRLVHGQVLEAWLPAIDANGILVADDEAARNSLVRSAMALAIPPRVAFQVLRVAEAAERLKPGGQGPPAPRTLLLLRDVRDAVALGSGGVPLGRLNLGNVHFRSGRKQVSGSVYLDADELQQLEGLAKQGAQVEARAVPAEAPVPLPVLQQRFANGYP
jgi:PTS system mannose-specific IIB component